MSLTVAKYAGFCAGVRRAVQGAQSVTEQASQSGRQVVSFGELAHNPMVIRRLAENGVTVIREPEEAQGKIVLIRSHGVAPDVMARLQESAHQVVDLTCGFVKRLHEVVSEYSLHGDPVILVGQRDHPEVIGTLGYAHGAVYTVADPQEAAALPQMERALAVSQTTFPQESWQEILPLLRERVTDLTVHCTICSATALRQTEARELARRMDAMLVVGGKSSANTRKLYETCKRYCGRTLLVERATEIPPGFANILRDSIGITAGASTPEESLREVTDTMADMEEMNRITSEEAEKEDFMAAVEANPVRIKKGQTVKGTVVLITDSEVCVNIGYKSDGMIKLEDLVTPDVKIGDEIEVEVVTVNDGDGNVVLSQRNLLARKAFAELVEKYNNGEYVEGIGKEVVKGGLICTVNGTIRAFVPASQLANRYVEKMDGFVGQTMKLKIIEIDEQKKRIVASRRQVVREENAARKEAAWSKLEEGAVVHGIVRRLTSFGAFVDLGGVDGLIHITDLSWAHIKDASQVVQPDQEVDVKIVKLDRERERIQLSLKELQPKPWELAAEKYPEGSIVTGTVVRTTTFGAFVELEPGIDALVHISQCADHRIQKVEDAVNIGDEITAKVLSIDPAARRISLSIRALLQPAVASVEEEPVEEEPAPVEEDSDAEATPVDIEAMVAQMANEPDQE